MLIVEAPLKLDRAVGEGNSVLRADTVPWVLEVGLVEGLACSTEGLDDTE